MTESHQSLAGRWGGFGVEFARRSRRPIVSARSRRALLDMEEDDLIDCEYMGHIPDVAQLMHLKVQAQRSRAGLPSWRKPGARLMCSVRASL